MMQCDCVAEHFDACQVSMFLSMAAIDMLHVCGHIVTLTGRAGIDILCIDREGIDIINMLCLCGQE